MKSQSRQQSVMDSSFGLLFQLWKDEILRRARQCMHGGFVCCFWLHIITSSTHAPFAHIPPSWSSATHTPEATGAGVGASTGGAVGAGVGSPGAHPIPPGVHPPLPFCAIVIRGIARARKTTTVRILATRDDGNKRRVCAVGH